MIAAIAIPLSAGIVAAGLPLGAILGTIGWVLLWILIGLCGLLLLLIVMPVGARAAGEIDDDDVQGYAAVRWAWGFLGVRFTAGEGTTLRLCGLRLWRFAPDTEEQRARKAEKKAEKKAAQARKRAEKKGADRPNPSLWTVLYHRRTLWGLVTRFGRALHLRVRIIGIVGTGDPADTATVMQLVRGVGRLVGRDTLQVEPDYVEERIALSGRASLWILPLQLIGIAAWAFLRKKTRVALRALRPRAPQKEQGR